jgi:transposase
MDGIEKELDRDGLISLVWELRREVAELRAENEQLRVENEQLRQRIEELEEGQAERPTRRLGESYSLDAEEQRRREADEATGRQRKRRQNSPRRGRISSQQKIDQADRSELVLPDGFDIGQCTPLRERPVWRIEQGQAVRVAYDIYRGPRGEIPVVEGVPARGEFGLEIHVTVAYLTFIVGLSMDKVCVLLKFFWNLELSKSQADALLNQLAREWESEFDALCQLLAVSAVVHADETSWSINSVWALLSEQARLLIFGCRKDGETLAAILPKETFEGILVSDDAAVYRGFNTAQKCWAHLIRKAIRLTLLEPENNQYREFLDGLLEIYSQAKRFAADQRLGETGRQRRVDELTNRMCDLCGQRHADKTPPASDTEKDFFNLVHELVRLLGEDELFTFVLHPEVEGTNNETERTLRNPSQARQTGRTSQTPRGARRRTILQSVIESLRLHLEEFTLAGVLKEVLTWLHSGESLFRRLLQSTGLPPPETSPLNQLIPES